MTSPASALALSWRSVAGPLLAHFPEPAVVLDAEGRVQLANAALLDLLDRDETQVVGENWGALLGPGSREATCPLSTGLSGQVPGRHCECVAILRGDRYLWLTIEHAWLDVGPPAARLLRITNVRDGVQPAQSRSLVEIRYSVSHSHGVWGTLLDRAVSRPTVCAQVLSDNTPGRPCYSAIFGRTEECPNCPVKQLDGDRQTVTAIFDVDEPFDGLGLVTAVRVSEDRVDVDSRVISEELLSTLLRARIDSIAERNGLSGREREVLNLLLLGRTLADMAKILGISTRTVRFHQGNVFEKLGADSRVDLLRVVVL